MTDQPEAPLTPEHCGQCGQLYREPACGPTHALIAKDKSIHEAPMSENLLPNRAGDYERQIRRLRAENERLKQVRDHNERQIDLLALDRNRLIKERDERWFPLLDAVDAYRSIPNEPGDWSDERVGARERLAKAAVRCQEIREREVSGGSTYDYD